MIALRMQQETKLLHSNIATKHMAVMYSRFFTNMNTELQLKHTRTGSNKHGKSAKDISFTDLVKILTCQKQYQEAMFRASKQQATGIYHSRQRNGMILLNA